MVKEEIELKRSLVELIEIINHFDLEIREKIPSEVIAFIEENKDENYVFIYNEALSLKEQEINSMTYALLIELYKTYIVDEEEKVIWDKYDNLINRQIEKEKSKNYFVDIFESENKKLGNNEEKIKEDVEIESNITIKGKNNFIGKIINFLRKILRKY